MAADPGAKSTRLPFRNISTPEGVPVQVRLAGRGARLGAVLMDLFLIALIIILIFLLAYFVDRSLDLSRSNKDLLIAGLLFIIFMVRSFYFSWFEVRWRGSTPGKRMVGIRVADRRGGRLQPSSLIARNIMREVELFLPVTFLFVRPYNAYDGLMLLLASLWLGIFVLLPLFNRDRLRAGDMVAGTWVINAPRQPLLRDVSLASAKSHTVLPGGRRQETTPDITFTPAQLEIYGVYELQTLERVLRSAGRNSEQTKQDVARRIAAKIGYEGTAPRFRTQEFLQAFYTAQRAKLESGLLMGQRKERKDVV
jgi:uncharacterized RDD family membrane protein YckC